MKKNSPHHKNKQAKKAVHKAQDLEYETDPKHPTEKQEEQYLSKGKSGKMAKGKQNFHHAKRSSPSEVTFETEPDSPHKEGAKWDKTTKSQSLDKAKRLDDKLHRKK